TGGSCHDSILSRNRASTGHGAIHSEQQVGALMQGGSSCAVLITSRRVLATLAVDERVALPGLDEGTAWGLLRRIGAGDRVDEDLEEGRDVVRLCGGLPLALRIVERGWPRFPPVLWNPSPGISLTTTGGRMC
ncbi:hypothetical protein P9869_24745, partial [Streptomyces ossamyceticus]|nr:hypothetical protein [Streptomyces ossamyceticus]